MGNKKYFIGNAHLDIAWQWKYQEGLSLIKSTYKSALDRMKEFPDYIFTSACGAYYEWIKESEPEMFDEIKERIEEGRWMPIGNMWVQPDCNIPSGESFARHLLYTERFFKENFGFIPTCGYNVDSFGHDGAFPMLFGKAGMNSYVYQRPNSDNEYPAMTKERLHNWIGNDGSQVTCYHIPDAYCGEVTEERLDLIESENYPGMFFFGVGNHGGGPTVRMLNKIEELRKEDKESFVYSDPVHYFNDVRNVLDIRTLDKVEGDLEHHASGCYSANSRIKKANRISEEKMIQAEKYDLLSNILTGSKIHKEEIEKSWKKLLFNQFHDVLAGCTVKDAEEDALFDFGYVSSTANEITDYSLERISFRINTTKYFENKESVMRDRMWRREGEGSPIVVFNPHSFPVKELVKTNCNAITGILDENDNPVPFQKIRANYTDGPYYNDFIFEADVPAFGYRTYFLLGEEQSAPVDFKSSLKITSRSMENDLVSISFNEDGSIREYKNKKTGRSYLKDGGSKAIVINDLKSDTWAHAIFSFPEKIGEFNDATFEIVDNGPLVSTLRVTTKYDGNVLTQDYMLKYDTDVLRVNSKLFFKEHHKIVKLEFPINVENPVARYSSSYGYLDKECDSLEQPSHKWMDVHDKIEGNGVAIINDSKYSWSAEGCTASVIIARGSAYLDHFGQDHRDSSMSYMDQGESEFSYAYVPHDGNYSDVVKDANLLNSPLSIIKETHHKGSLPSDYQGMDVSSDHVIVETIKESENKDAYVIRAYESNGTKTDCTIRLNFLSKALSLSFKPFEAKTIMIDKNTLEYHEVMISEYEF